MALLNDRHAVALVRRWPGGSLVQRLRDYLQTGADYRAASAGLTDQLSIIAREIARFAALYQSQVVVERFGPFETGFETFTLSPGFKDPVPDGEFTRIYPLMPFPAFLDEVRVRLKLQGLPDLYLIPPAWGASQTCGRCLERGYRSGSNFMCMSRLCGWEGDADENAAWVLGRFGWSVVYSREELVETLGLIAQLGLVPRLTAALRKLLGSPLQ